MERVLQLAREWFSTSIARRIIGLTLLMLLSAFIILSFFVMWFVSQNVLQARQEFADQEITRVRQEVEEHISQMGLTRSIKSRLESTQAKITSSNSQSSQAKSIYTPILIAEGENGEMISTFKDYQVSQELRDLVGDNQVAYQFDEVYPAEGISYRALIIGSPVDSEEIPGLQLYLVFSTEQDWETVSQLRLIISVAGFIAILITFCVMVWGIQQVVKPLKEASRVADRFADNHLKDRMKVLRNDEIGKLAQSFNYMAESLSSKIAQLRDYGDLQQRFSSDVSHELRTPLTSIRGATDILGRDYESLSPVSQRAWRLLDDSVERYQHLLIDLLDISHYDEGAVTLKAETDDVVEILTSTFETLRPLSEKFSVPLRLHLPESDNGEPPTVLAEVDRSRLERIIRNLVSNALDYAEGKPVDVYLDSNETCFSIAVVDHGVGLKEGQEELVFERFWRADESRQRHFGGTGLGLSISREDAEIHGGVLKAAGKLHVGSMFLLSIPLRQGHPIGTPAIPLSVPQPLTAEDLDSDHLEADAVPSFDDAVQGDTGSAPEESAFQSDGIVGTHTEAALPGATAHPPQGYVAQHPPAAVTQQATVTGHLAMDVMYISHEETSEHGGQNQ